jgi:hypothetical protein
MHRLIAPIAAILFAFTANAQTAPPPNPHPYTALYVFGDSYSDTGAGFVYADGPTAVAYLAQRLAIPFTYYGAPDAQNKSLNFSVSAAKTGSGPGRRDAPNALFALGMKEQVDEFAALLHSGALHFDPAQTMFFLAGGLNDRGMAAGYTRTNLESQIDALYSLGGRRFLVALLPTQIPAFASAGAQFNPDLARIPADERARHTPRHPHRQLQLGPILRRGHYRPRLIRPHQHDHTLRRPAHPRRQLASLRLAANPLLLLYRPPFHRRPPRRRRLALPGEPHGCPISLP